MHYVFKLLWMLCSLIVICAAEPKKFEENCYCADHWNETLLEQKAKFEEPKGNFVYRGVIEGLLASYYKPCLCYDVVRLQMSMLVYDVSDLYEAFQEDSDEDGETVKEKVVITEMQVRQQIFKSFYILQRKSGASAATKDLDNRVSKIFIRNMTWDNSSIDMDMTLVIKGSDPNLAAAYMKAIMDSTNKGGTTYNKLPDVGKFNITKFGVMTCKEDPPPAPSGGEITRGWLEKKLPPSRANYTCGEGLFVQPLNAGESHCQHETLTWSPLKNLSCTSGCGTNPPSIPYNTYSTWDKTTRQINHTVTYYCFSGFRSGDSQNATSVCEPSGKWSPLPDTFFCSEMDCNGTIPQVPAHTVTNFNPKRRIASTVVKYWCDVGYRSINERNVSTECRMGAWDPLNPPGWHCINILDLNPADILKGEMDLPESELTEAELIRKRDILSDPLYFWTLTIPSIIGLMAAMMVCLCCTRTDSPLYFICNINRNKKSEYREKIERLNRL